MSALRPRTFRLQIVILVALGLATGTAMVVAAASPESTWETVHADKHLDGRVSLDEDLGVFLVEGGDRVIALANHGPWNDELVQYCPSSQLFETGWSGSKFDLYGRYLMGPASRGMSHYRVRRRGDEYQVIPHALIAGPGRAESKDGVRMPVGPYCVPA